jgi:hypothetical protein
VINGHFTTLLSRTLASLTLNAVTVSFYLSGLDIHLEAEEVGLAGQVSEAVSGLLTSSSLVDLKHLAELIDITLNGNGIEGHSIRGLDLRGIETSLTRFSLNDGFD